MNKLAFGISRSLGKTQGRIVSFHREQGHKKLYRLLDKSRALPNLYGKVLKVMPDPFRTGHIAIIAYSNGIMSHILANEGLRSGDYVLTLGKKSLRVKNQGNYKYTPTRHSVGSLSFPVKMAFVGESIFNIETIKGGGGSIACSAGTFSIVRKKNKSDCLLQLPSGVLLKVPLDVQCSAGRCSNQKHKETNVGKAGKNRWLGWRPVTRGRAMNPVDHPHGGRTNGGVTPKTPWGLIAKGIATRKKSKGALVKKK